MLNDNLIPDTRLMICLLVSLFVISDFEKILFGMAGKKAGIEILKSNTVQIGNEPSLDVLRHPLGDFPVG
jgi:hypothetical protein